MILVSSHRVMERRDISCVLGKVSANCHCAGDLSQGLNLTVDSKTPYFSRLCKRPFSNLTRVNPRRTLFFFSQCNQPSRSLTATSPTFMLIVFFLVLARKMKHLSLIISFVFDQIFLGGLWFKHPSLTITGLSLLDYSFGKGNSDRYEYITWMIDERIIMHFI